MIDTSKVLVYNNEFGTVTVVHPAPKYDRSDVPTDRSFRNAWTYTP